MKMIQILEELTSNILETMFFLIQETPCDTEPKYKYGVNIKDTKVDIIILYCERTAQEMSVNFLGTDEIKEQDLCDTLKESINIIAGNFIGSEFAEANTRIRIPEMIPNIDAIKQSEYESTMLWYNEEPVKILLKIE